MRPAGACLNPRPPALNETPMTQSDYEAELLRILRAHDATARATLTALIAALPPKAREIHIVVFPDQDGEGTFSVVASLEGPDLFVLNKAIEGHRYLFDVRHTEDGIEPEVPLFGSDEAGFDVQNVIVDTAMQWVGELWDACGRGRSPLPGLVYGEEGYGTREPLVLPV